MTLTSVKYITSDNLILNAENLPYRITQPKEKIYLNN